jgi:Calcium binding
MAKSRNRPVAVVRIKRQPSAGTGRRGRIHPRLDPEREQRITMEVIVDAYDASERATGWFAYLENELEFPFTARCADRRAISPLLVGDEVEVVSMAPSDECSHEIFVMIRWEHGGLGVPLSQLEPSAADEKTKTAVTDWRYWIGQGYQF